MVVILLYQFVEVDTGTRKYNTKSSKIRYILLVILYLVILLDPFGAQWKFLINYFQFNVLVLSLSFALNMQCLEFCWEMENGVS